MFNAFSTHELKIQLTVS